MSAKPIAFIYFLFVASVSSAGEEQIKLKNALSSFREDYSPAKNHKAFAQSAEGAWAWSAEKATVQNAIDDAVARCTNNLKPGQGLCIAIHIDTEWVPKEQIEKQKSASYNDNKINAERIGILTLTDENIKRTIDASKGRLVVQFSSYDHGCGYCVFSNIPFEKLVPSYSGAVQFARITWQPWAKLNSEIINYYHVYGLPALIVFNDGKEEFRVEGWRASLEKDVRDKLDVCCKR